jgi:hydroxymethylglutaryl-CoA reductase (NADPH)
VDPAKRQPDELTDLVRSIVAGERRLHDLPGELTAEQAAAVRRRAVEAMRASDLEHSGRYSLDAGRAASRHCENFIGISQVPLGVAGPLNVRGRMVQPEETIYVPLATTEGALIASVNRGCRAIALAGGAVVRVEDVGMTRAPVFRATGIEQSERFLDWLRDNEARIREVAEGTSRFLRLAEIKTQAIGTSIFVRFRFSSGDAMGMNMATIACDRVVRELIEPETEVRCVALSGNYCVDKKPSAINFLEGRGKRIHAEVELGREILEDCLKTRAEAMIEVQYRKNLIGSIAAGAMGSNAHFANVLAAFFIATGQDVAQVVEGSMGMTTVERSGEGGVLASIFMPDVPLGVVGGGTALDTQREALALLGAEAKADSPGAGSLRLAEILGATVLAGEISLMAAFTSGDLAGAHERLGRGNGSS